jgi:protein-S-isoprenylcysteine O-methyltransferase Ste14
MASSNDIPAVTPATSPPARRRGPGVHLPPPLLFVVAFGLGWYLDRRLEFAIDGDGAGLVQSALGAAGLAAGFAMMLWAVVTFALARTPIYPNRPARQLVMSGPYRFSRNPMYLGLTVAYLGGTLATNLAWPLVLLPPVLAVVRIFIIGREERYLSEAFGSAYDGYRRRVRRWI